TDTPTRKSERVPTEKPMEVVIDELPVEREIVGDEYWAAFSSFTKPPGEVVHDSLRIVKSHVLFTRETAYSQRLGNEPIRNGSCPSVKASVELIIENHSTKAHHRKLRWDRSVRLNIDDDVTHNGWPMTSTFRIWT